MFLGEDQSATYPEAEFCETFPGSGKREDLGRYRHFPGYKPRLEGSGSDSGSPFFLQLQGLVVCADRKVSDKYPGNVVDKCGFGERIIEDTGEMVYGEGEDMVIVEYEDVI